jgi:dimethylglycine dehydrogenase
MDRFLHPDKGPFVGREALVASRESGLRYRLVTLEVIDVGDADALGNNALTLNGELIGRATGGGYGFRIGKSLALGMVGPEYATPGQELSIEILGRQHKARVLEESPFDGKNKRLRDVN